MAPDPPIAKRRSITAIRSLRDMDLFRKIVTRTYLLPLPRSTSKMIERTATDDTFSTPISGRDRRAIVKPVRRSWSWLVVKAIYLQALSRRWIMLVRELDPRRKCSLRRFCRITSTRYICDQKKRMLDAMSNGRGEKKKTKNTSFLPPPTPRGRGGEFSLSQIKKVFPGT